MIWVCVTSLQVAGALSGLLSARHAPSNIQHVKALIQLLKQHGDNPAVSSSALLLLSRWATLQGAVQQRGTGGGALNGTHPKQQCAVLLQNAPCEPTTHQCSAGTPWQEGYRLLVYACRAPTRPPGCAPPGGRSCGAGPAQGCWLSSRPLPCRDTLPGQRRSRQAGLALLASKRMAPAGLPYMH
jgi:hypothetical protein